MKFNLFFRGVKTTFAFHFNPSLVMSRHVVVLFKVKKTLSKKQSPLSAPASCSKKTTSLKERKRPKRAQTQAIYCILLLSILSNGVFYTLYSMKIVFIHHNSIQTFWMMYWWWTLYSRVKCYSWWNLIGPIVSRKEIVLLNNCRI